MKTDEEKKVASLAEQWLNLAKSQSPVEKLLDSLNQTFQVNPDLVLKIFEQAFHQAFYHRGGCWLNTLNDLYDENEILTWIVGKDNHFVLQFLDLKISKEINCKQAVGGKTEEFKSGSNKTVVEGLEIDRPWMKELISTKPSLACEILVKKLGYAKTPQDKWNLLFKAPKLFMELAEKDQEIAEKLLSALDLGLDLSDFRIVVELLDHYQSVSGIANPNTRDAYRAALPVFDKLATQNPQLLFEILTFKDLYGKKAISAPEFLVMSEDALLKVAEADLEIFIKFVKNLMMFQYKKEQYHRFSLAVPDSQHLYPRIPVMRKLLAELKKRAPGRLVELLKIRTTNGTFLSHPHQFFSYVDILHGLDEKLRKEITETITYPESNFVLKEDKAKWWLSDDEIMKISRMMASLQRGTGDSDFEESLNQVMPLMLLWGAYFEWGKKSSDLLLHMLENPIIQERAIPELAKKDSLRHVFAPQLLIRLAPEGIIDVKGLDERQIALDKLKPEEFAALLTPLGENDKKAILIWLFDQNRNKRNGYTIPLENILAGLALLTENSRVQIYECNLSGDMLRDLVELKEEILLEILACKNPQSSGPNGKVPFIYAKVFKPDPQKLSEERWVQFVKILSIRDNNGIPFLHDPEVLAEAVPFLKKLCADEKLKKRLFTLLTITSKKGHTLLSPNQNGLVWHHVEVLLKHLVDQDEGVFVKFLKLGQILECQYLYERIKKTIIDPLDAAKRARLSKTMDSLRLSTTEAVEKKRRLIEFLISDVGNVQAVSIAETIEDRLIDFSKLIAALPLLYKDDLDKQKKLASKLTEKWLKLETGMEWGIAMNLHTGFQSTRTEGEWSFLTTNKAATLVSDFIDRPEGIESLSTEAQKRVAQATLSGAQTTLATEIYFPALEKASNEAELERINLPNGRKLKADLEKYGIITIQSGWCRHAVGLTIHKAKNGKYYLYYCNRGGRAFEKGEDRALLGGREALSNGRKGVDMVRWEIGDHAALTAELLGKIAAAGWAFSTADRNNFAKPFLEGANGLVKILDLKDCQFIAKTPQKIGNCSWANCKGSVHAAAIAARYDEFIESGTKDFCDSNWRNSVNDGTLYFKQLERYGRSKGLQPLLRYDALEDPGELSLHDHVKALTATMQKLEKKIKESEPRLQYYQTAKVTWKADTEMRAAVLDYFDRCEYPLSELESLPSSLFPPLPLGPADEQKIKNELRKATPGAFVIARDRCWFKSYDDEIYAYTLDSYQSKADSDTQTVSQFKKAWKIKNQNTGDLELTYPIIVG